jgi:hypothetical protein
MNLLSNYCRKNDIKTSITVGIVGKNFIFYKFFQKKKFSLKDFQMLEKVV